MALISVIIPMNNCAAQLPETIRALQAQLWTRWEAFLVDDRSTEDSLAVADAMALRDPRLRVIASPAPGEAAAINHAAQTRARGQIIAICRPGDVWLPVKLADVARMILTEGADAAFGAVRLHSKDGRNGARSAVPDRRPRGFCARPCGYFPKRPPHKRLPIGEKHGYSRIRERFPGGDVDEK